MPWRGILAFLVLGKTMNGMQLMAVIFITLGLIGISLIERRLGEEEGNAQHKLGALALIFPLLYAVVDALGTFF